MRVSSLSRRDIESLEPGVRKRGRFVTLTRASFSTVACTCIVSKKVCPEAHDRNTLKRRLRALAREVLAGKTNTALIVRAEKNAAQATFSDLRDDMKSLVK